MGDRTTVQLSVLREHKEVVSQIYINSIGDVISGDHEDDAYFSFNVYDVHGGELDSLDELVALGIAYDSEWDQGNDYGPGGEYLRFTPEGGLIIQSIYDSEKSISVDYLSPHINDLAALQKIIQENVDRIAVLSWDNQTEYGKIYQTRKLIAPK